MGNELSVCGCGAKPKKKKRKLKKMFNDVGTGVSLPSVNVPEFSNPGHGVPREYDDAYRRGVGIASARDRNQDVNSEYVRREVANNDTQCTPSCQMPLGQQTTRHGSIKRQKSLNSNKRSPESEQQTSEYGSIKRQRSFNSGKHSPEINRHANGHGSLKRQKSQNKRPPEPPRLVMWGLYEPKCPSHDWSLRVQKERVTAMEHGRAMWDGESSLPRYLRRYFRENMRHSEPVNTCSEFHRSDYYPFLERPASYVQPSSSKGNENFSYVDHCLSESAVNSSNLKSLENRRLQPKPSPLKYDGARENRMNASESDSAFRSLSSFKSTESPTVSYEDAFHRSRYTIRDPRCSTHRKVDLLSIYTAEKATQYEEYSESNSNKPKILESTDARKGGSTDSYIALQESLDYLQNAVEELDSFAETFMKNASSSRPPGISKSDPPFEKKENFESFEKNPAFAPKAPISNNSECHNQTENGTSTTAAIDVNSNVAHRSSRKETLSFGSESELFPIMEVTEETILPMSSILKHALHISGSMETIERSEISLLTSEESSPAVSMLSGRKSRKSGSSTYVKDGLVHYRIRVVASPNNLNLFRMAALPSESQKKSLAEIAKESQCQLYLLPRKDYSAGVPKRTLLIRSLRRRYIKLCLREISEHFPSLVRLR